MSDARMAMDAIRARLDGSRGRQYWRSLEDVAETAEFKEFLVREFPQHASEWLEPVGRRGFLKLMGASLALAGVSACTRQPDEVIVPYVHQPEELVPGRPMFYATAMPHAEGALGLLVESHEGRPTKIEGNPDHPSSRGATDIYAQAAILGLYDPDRSQTITQLGDIKPFISFVGAMRDVLTAQRRKQGGGLRILTGTVTSPTLAAQIRDLLGRFPNAKWIQWEPCARHNAREGSGLAFGEYVDPQYALDKADVIVSFDTDILCAGPSGVKHARAFASRRRLEGDPQGLNRLYAVESTPTNTGTKADHRLPLRVAEIETMLRALAARLGIAGLTASADVPAAAARWLDLLGLDLGANRGRSLVLAGDALSPASHALVHAINDTLGNVGTTVSYTQPAALEPTNQHAALDQLVGDMYAQRVDVLLVLGANPVYTAPANLHFADAMQKVGLRVHHGLYEDETAALCHWHIPEAHFLETWSDVRAEDGTVTIIQPLIAPLYQGKSAHEVLAAFTPRPEQSGYDIVRDHWASASGLSTTVEAPAPSAGTSPPDTTGLVSAFDVAWRRWLHDGFIPNTAFAGKAVAVRADLSARLGARVESSTPTGPGTLEVVFRPDPTVYDGRFANNAWLQELPKPLTKLTWDNAALLAPATADRLHLVSGDVVTVAHEGRTLRIPVWLAPGHAQDCLTLHLGYGRTRAGRTGSGAGFDVNTLRHLAAPFVLHGAQLAKTGERYQLACTQDHWSLEGRNLVRVGTKEEYDRNPGFVREQELVERQGLSMYAPYKYDGYAWGMSIDQNVCTGCSACIVACQAENNIPVVGKSQVLNHREMQWLRVDRYYTGDIDAPDTYHQPMPCQQCESAPCEVVCPVAATSHSDEGLNDMVYNRCVGTRYCSNNCPYKVRRFNFLLYQDFDTPTFKLMRNPDVTVRSRGVMEKCTYCVQRINHARADAIREERPIRDGEILTACQSVCPTEAIVFGNINDPSSRVTQLKKSPRNYSLLAELNTKPRTTYLAIIRNPNPALEPRPTRAGQPGEER
jgi:molybdopterin-containing oxidoreductase family iron-sulfur binding subunit